MDVIEVLMNEHRMIESVLDEVHVWVDAMLEEKRDDREQLGRFVKFIVEFADGWHHGKEEEILFKTMTEHGFPSQFGPIAVMLQEHTVGRELVGQLGRFVQQTTPWDDSARHQIARTALSYVDLLRNHIQKEDQVLYPMAKAKLPQPAMASMATRFEAFENGFGRTEERSRVWQLGLDLTESSCCGKDG